MKHLYIAPLAALMLMITFSAHGSALRITCEGVDADAEVYINGKFSGECPVDIKVPAGTIKLRVLKKPDADHERIFEKEFRMAEGSAKKIEVELSAPRLTAQAEKRLAQENLRKMAALKKQGFDAGQVIRDCPACPEMVVIPNGIAMGKYEVTQAEWQAVMGTNPSRFKDCGENCPVEQVSWDDIQEFMTKLNQKTGKQYRLPTEAEWEYACYGGSQTEYCGSNDANSVGWNNSNSNSTTHPVGQKQANGYGLYDMTGNVWEWQSDCAEGGCAERVLRGGSCSTTPQHSRVAYRLRIDAAIRGNSRGFRLARTLP